MVPFALLVPFVGSAASSIVFGERFGPLRLAGMVTVVVRHRDHAAVEAARKPIAKPSCRRSPERKAMSHSLLLAFVIFAA